MLCDILTCFFFLVHIPRIIEEIAAHILNPSNNVLLPLILTIFSFSIYYLDHEETLHEKLTYNKIIDIITASDIHNIISVCKNLFNNGLVREKTINALRMAGCTQGKINIT